MGNGRLPLAYRSRAVRLGTNQPDRHNIVINKMQYRQYDQSLYQLGPCDSDVVSIASDMHVALIGQQLPWASTVEIKGLARQAVFLFRLHK